VQVGCSPPGKKFQRGDQGKNLHSPLEFLRNLRENLKGGTKGNFLDYFLEMFLKNVSFAPPFEISIEFRQKFFKNYDFC
jgi:hypothetical protein